MSVSNLCIDWTFQQAECPLQTNTSDCGIHVLVNLFQITTTTFEIIEASGNTGKEAIGASDIGDSDSGLWRNLLTTLIAGPTRNPSEQQMDQITLLEPLPWSKVEPLSDIPNTIKILQSLHAASESSKRAHQYARTRYAAAVHATRIFESLRDSCNKKRDELAAQASAILEDITILEAQIAAVSRMTTITNEDRTALLSQPQRQATCLKARADQVKINESRLKEYLHAIEATIAVAAAAAEQALETETLAKERCAEIAKALRRCAENISEAANGLEELS